MMKRRLYASLATSIFSLAVTSGCIVPLPSTYTPNDVPEGLHAIVSSIGCSSAGRCPFRDGKAHNWYDTETREIVMAPGQPLRVWAHEACHAHQHQMVIENGEVATGDLHEWYRTSEAVAYNNVTSGVPHPTDWRMSADTLIEDYAESCARFIVGMSNEPNREAFFSERGIR